jgi:hypothetical protein
MELIESGTANEPGKRPRTSAMRVVVLLASAITIGTVVVASLPADATSGVECPPPSAQLAAAQGTQPASTCGTLSMSASIPTDSVDDTALWTSDAVPIEPTTGTTEVPS